MKIFLLLLFTKEIPIMIRDEGVPCGEILVDLLEVRKLVLIVVVDSKLRILVEFQDKMSQILKNISLVVSD